MNYKSLIHAPNPRRHLPSNLLSNPLKVFPCMVELLLQHEPGKYPSRLLALQHMSTLRVCGRLSRTWVDEGYYSKISHLVPPPPRMPRLFSVEEGDAMYQRAAARSTPFSAPAAAARLSGVAPENDEGGASRPTVDANELSKGAT